MISQYTYVLNETAQSHMSKVVKRSRDYIPLFASPLNMRFHARKKNIETSYKGVINTTVPFLHKQV
jgi:hypothetical protein